MKLVHGKNVIMYLFDGVSEYYPFLCSTDCVINISTELIGATSINSGAWQEFAPRRNSWSIQLSGVTEIANATNNNGIFDLITETVRQSGLHIKIIYTDPDANTKSLSGKVFIPESSISGNVSDFSTWETSFQGSGVLTIDSSTLPPQNGSMQTYTYTASGGETNFTATVLISRTIHLVFRDTMHLEIIISGDPVNNQVKYVAATGGIIFPTGMELIAGEKIKVVYE